MQPPKLSPLSSPDDSDEMGVQGSGQTQISSDQPPISNASIPLTADEDSDGTRTVIGGPTVSALSQGSGRATPSSTKKIASAPPPAVQVETETVPSVPALAVQTAPSGAGSLRIKKSQDSVPRTAGRAKKRPSRLATTSKAEMFAAKVASAVDKATTSDSDEEFVYDANPAPQDTLRHPYLRTRLSALASTGTTNSGPPTVSAPAAASVNSINNSGSNVGSPLLGSGFAHGTYTGDTQGPQDSQALSSDAGPRQDYGSRGPFVVSRQPANGTERSPLRPTRIDSMRAKNIYLNRWRGSVTADDDRDIEMDDDDDDAYVMRDSRLIPVTESSPLRRSASAQYRYLAQRGQAPTPSPHDYGPSAKPPPLYVRLTLWIIILLMCMLGVSFIAGIFLASSRPLQNLHIARLSDVFPSDKELVFAMVVGAENPGYLSIQISDAELDIFATSKHVGDKQRTILLGTITELESPLVFQGTFFQMANRWASTTAKLINSCDEGDTCDQWNNITTNPFELNVRGSLQYRMLLGTEIKVPVQASVHVSSQSDVEP
ncbi:hypothetical protein B9G98_03157 [Wickerhamiella sorbophila]|uniref:Vacuolar segregation protein 7 n=1 Tax=Wickerhamiella sorbophila TaxID=45607 RepID=A0A2T0FKP3_9ASCO|nr:hypothetical protein B9G98_03157 [Wickerhamiella sorbophila]PRT55537.1 hypothetical protein B9G98_03157 [Wickerhamiella sorbophila]